MKEKIKNLLKKIPMPKRDNNKRHSLYINILVPTIVFALIGIVVVAYSLQHGVKKVMNETYQEDLERCKTIILDAISEEQKQFRVDVSYIKHNILKNDN